MIIYKNIDVIIDIDLEEFGDEDILEEVERRNLKPVSGEIFSIIEKLYYHKQKDEHFDTLLNELFYKAIGRIN